MSKIRYGIYLRTIYRHDVIKQSGLHIISIFEHGKNKIFE